MDLEKAFGQVLRRYRERAGISQESLAEAMSYHKNAIGMLERGERKPTLFTVFALAGCLGVSPEQLVHEVRVLSEQK